MMYNYEELIRKVKEDASQENLTALAEWFDQNGQMYWNGECYDTQGELGYNLYPVYEEVEEDMFEIKEWKLR